MKYINRYTRTARRFFVGLITSAYIATAGMIGTVMADDTEIYVADFPTGGTSNILFVLDTSGSMNTTVAGSTQTRMDAVKEGLIDLISSEGNFRMGLATFHPEYGGPINFPVSDLNASVDSSNGEVAVAIISDNSDDAEEDAATGVVTLGNENPGNPDTLLEMTDKEFVVGGTAQTWASDPTAHVSVDDDEEGEGGGFNEIDSPDMDVGAVNLGVRFRQVDIPKNAVILHAEVVFETRAGNSGATRSIIRGHDVDDAPNFASQNVVSRMSQLTSALVPWSNIPADIAGDTVRTPNIRSVVQEIVTRPGWVSNNDIAIMFSASQGNREYESYDNGTDGPQLVVTYAIPGTTGISQQIVDGDDDAEQYVSGANYLVAGNSLDIAFQGTNEQQVALRFPNVSIPANAVVLRADIDFVVGSERIGQADFLIHAQEAPDATHFDTGNGGIDILSRTNRTDPANAVVWSDVAAPRVDETLQTPDLSALITEVIADSVTPWDPSAGNNHLVFIFEDNASSGSRGLCSVEGCDVESAILNVWYTLPIGSTTTSQFVGLRFNNLSIPQGSQILEAAIDFTVGSASTEDSALTIAIENSDNAPPFTNTNTDISGRLYSGAVNWNPGPWDTVGATQSTVNADGSAVDLASLMQSVINDPNWCGGNAVAFKVDVQTALTARRIAKSFESSAAESPILRVKYNFDPTLATTGCVKRTFVSTITTGNNDAEENSSGSVLLNGTNLDLDTSNLVGLRFDNVQIPQGATISDTRITLTSEDNDDTGSATIKFTAQQSPNAPTFTNSNNDISNRVTASDPSVNWSFSNEWDLGDVNTTDVNLSPTIQPVINDAAWEPGNALALVLDTTTGERDATPVNANTPRRPARIEIDWQANLVASGLPALSTRDKLIETIEAIRPRGWTPTIDAMFEGASYMLGQAVHYGKTRGAGSVYTPNLENDQPGSGESTPIDTSIANDTDDELLQEDAEHSILSHPASFTPAITPTRQGLCTALNPDHPDCANERLVGNANYISPLATGSECEKGFMIVLSDGIANRNSSSTLIDTMIGAASCDIQITTIDTNGDPILVAGNPVTRPPAADEACGADLAKYLFESDFITDADPLNPVVNNVRTFTIGFGLPFDTDDPGTNVQNKSAVEMLKQIAAEGSGEYGEGFFPAENASQLNTVFDVILSDIVDETTSLVSPGLSINAFNRLFNRNDVYFSSFKPSETTAWFGNMKKFQLCLDTSASPSCLFGEVIDNDSPQKPAVHLDATDPATFGTLKDDAIGFWNTDTDDAAPEVLDGGAGQKIPTWTARRAYTYTPATAPATPSFTNVKTAGTTLEKIEPADAGASVGSDLKTRLFQTGNCGGDASSTPGSGDDACLSEMIEWLLGKKFDGDIPRHGNDSDVDRWSFGAPMHGRPLVLTMGKIPNTGDASDPTDDDPISKIVVGANDGGLRMINEHTGQEEWIFYPQTLLGMQESLKINDVGPIQYGVDGNTTGRIYDCNSDGSVDPDQATDCSGDGTVDVDDKDFIHVYTGMRRGGRNIYAINVTPEAKLDTSAERSALDKVTPELLWRIEGGSSDFALLGQTWSNVLPTRINGPNGPQTAIVFGGGYDPTEDNGAYRNATVGDSQGNAIYIADADTGARLFWVSNTGSGADLELDGMNTAIPATVSLVDNNGDGLTDTIYAVDLRGQVWRVDLSVAGGAVSGTGGRLAVLGSDAADADKRKFFYTPAVSQVNDEQFSGGVYNLIGIVSGDRSEPNGTLTMERAYAIRDYLTDAPINSSGSNYPQCNPLNAGSCTEGTPLDHTTLLDVTEAVNFVLVDQDSDTVSGPVDTLKESHGWYFELEGNGEKGFSAATVLGGKMFFTTYLPPDGVIIDPDDACSASAALGTSRFYAVDFFTGAPAFEFFDGTTGYTKLDRYKGLGAGPSADVVPAFFEPGTTLVVPTGAGAIPEDPDLGDTLFKSYWNQPR